jgi:hypothetical protein
MQKRQFACVFLISSISLTGLYYNRSAQLHGKYGFYIENYTKRFKFHPFKKSLEIPKEKSESVNRRRTDNTMAKRKKGK